MTDKEMDIAVNAIHNFLEEKQEELKYKLENTLRKNIDHLANDNFNERITNNLRNTLDLIDKIDEYISDEDSAIWDWIYSYYEFEESEK